MALTYGKYLKLETLLDLQVPMSEPAEHDEMLFIIVHQTYELWFKQLLHELDKVCRDFDHGDLFGALTTFKRARTIMKTLVGQLDILETMTPMSFSSFRDRLETSSGFQSAQFREFEFLLGYKRPDMMKPAAGDARGAPLMSKRFEEPSVTDHFYTFLEKQGATIPATVKQAPVTESTVANEAVQDEIFRLYTERPELSILFELMTDFDEGLQEWRYRHVKVVERTIGIKPGTGGSLGVDFLKKSLFLQVFPDLWAVRHRM